MLIIVPEQVPGYAKVGNQLQTTERGSPMDQVPGTQPPNTNPKDFGSKNLQSVWPNVQNRTFETFPKCFVMLEVGTYVTYEF